MYITLPTVNLAYQMSIDQLNFDISFTHYYINDHTSPLVQYMDPIGLCLCLDTMQAQGFYLSPRLSVMGDILLFYHLSICLSHFSSDGDIVKSNGWIYLISES